MFGFWKYYCHEIYSVLTVLFILGSALFVTPDFTQKLALVYAFVFLLHEWEENNYPGGFFDVLFGDIAGLNKEEFGKKLKESRRFVYVLLVVLTFGPFLFHSHTWLILPIVYLGLIEGMVHSVIMPRVILRDRYYTPGMVTAVIQFALSVCTLCVVIRMDCVVVWQYVAAFFLLLLGLMYMAFNGIRSNGFRPKDVFLSAKQNIRMLRNK